MANAEHLAILKQGVEDWNRWREENSETTPDLSNAVLFGVDLRGANLGSTSEHSIEVWHMGMARSVKQEEKRTIGANLTLADLRSANLRNANLTGATLSGASLDGAMLAGSNMAASQIGTLWIIDLGASITATRGAR